MITASRGSFRFESGPTFHFNGSNFEELSDVVVDPSFTVNYVNTLPKVDTTPEEMRQVAASGIARLAIAQSDTSLLERTGNMFVDVVNGGMIDRSEYANRYSGRWGKNKDVFGYGLDNQILDSASVLAMRRNDEEATAAKIRETVPTDNGYFVIALARGGLISAARTYLHLGEGDHKFGMVKYSRHKDGDKKPDLNPDRNYKLDWLKARAKERQVIIYDEDYSTGVTLNSATQYFSEVLDTQVIGIAPVEVDRRISYNPLIVRSE